MSARISLFTALIGIIQMVSSASVPEAASNIGLFAADLFQEVAKTAIAENVILSPISIQSALAMTYLGAEGETAKELVKGLRLASDDKEVVGEYFANVLQEPKGESELNIANRFFVNSGYTLRPTFNELARKYFQSEAETVDFRQSADAIKMINTWIEQKTNKKITEVLEPGSVDDQTIALIVNAIYFKGKWQIPFSKDMTRTGQFWVSPTKSVNTQFMTGDEDFKYAELPDLEATAIELPYLNSDLSMIVILPNERDGLAKLEEKLSSVPINKLTSKLIAWSVQVLLPKFKIEFTTKLTDVLKTMGIRSIFENTANLSGIFQSDRHVSVSGVQHTASIDVNEEGSEAAAATILNFSRSARLVQQTFIADHPFVFAIRSRETVYFVGHVAKF